MHSASMSVAFEEENCYIIIDVIVTSILKFLNYFSVIMCKGTACVLTGTVSVLSNNSARYPDFY